MITIAKLPRYPSPFRTLVRKYRYPPRVNARPRRCPVVRAQITADMIIHAVQLTTKLFTAAVFVYSTLNFWMYYRARREIEKKQKEDDDQQHH